MTIEAFLDSRAAAGRAATTVHWYGRMLRHFEHWLGRPAGEATATELERYLAARRNQGLSPSSIAASYRALRAFFSWAKRRKIIRRSPIRMIDSPKVPRRPPRRAGVGEIERLLTAIDGGEWTDYRDRALILLGFYSGLRVGELVALELGDVDLARGLVWVRAGKGDKARFVPVHPRLKVEVGGYLYSRPLHGNGHLWYGADGAGGIRGPFTADGVRQMLKRRSVQAGIAPLNPHALRHGFATAFATAGADLAALARMMGHSSTAVTERFYAEWLEEGIQREYRDALARLMGNSG